MTSSGNRRSLPPVPVIEALKLVVDGLREAIGPDCEVVLHDLRDVRSTIVALAGNLTNRSIGGPPTDLLLKLLHDGDTDKHAVNYETQTDDGKVFRSSTLFLKDESGETVGSLCINVDITYVRHFRNWITAFCDVGEPLSGDTTPAERFPRDVHTVLETAISEAIDAVGVPVVALRKADRMRIIEILASKGIFSIRSSLVYVARRLNVSRATIYNYLEEISASK